MFANPATYELWRIPVLIAWWVIPAFVWLRGLARDSDSDLVAGPVLAWAFSVIMGRTMHGSGVEWVVTFLLWLLCMGLLGLLLAILARPLRSWKSVRRSGVLLGLAVILALILPQY